MTGKHTSIAWSVIRRDSTLLKPAYDVSIGDVTFRLGHTRYPREQWLCAGANLYSNGSLDDALACIRNYILNNHVANTVQD